jgi:hypothetical protein
MNATIQQHIPERPRVPNDNLRFPRDDGAPVIGDEASIVRLTRGQREYGDEGGEHWDTHSAFLGFLSLVLSRMTMSQKWKKEKKKSKWLRLFATTSERTTVSRPCSSAKKSKGRN